MTQIVDLSRKNLWFSRDFYANCLKMKIKISRDKLSLFSSRGMYIRSTSDIPLKWKDIRNSYMPLNWDDMRSIADIMKLDGTVALNKTQSFEDVR